MRQNKYEYDAFISHAVEDKIPIANELCAKLERAGLKIWYSGKELGIGDSIEKTIEKGLHRSRYGIVIFSPTYLAKNWTIREFYTLLAKEIEEQKVILPVLYNISLDDLKNKDLLMADRFAVNADRGIDFVVDRLVREIRKPKLEVAHVAWFSKIWLVLILSLLANVALVVKGFMSVQGANPVPARSAIFGSGDELVNPGLLHEMQGLVNRFNSCTCNRSREKANAPVFSSNLVSDEPGRLRDKEDTPVHGSEKSTLPGRKAGNKMTMAVVFQIETLPATSEPTIEGEVDDMLQTLSLAGDNEPFLTVSNRRDHSPRACSHANSLGD